MEAALRGKVLVQLTTGTPADARNCETWAEASGALYLDGAILAYPREIGSDGATILYSGSRSGFEHNLDLLKALGGVALFCGEQVGRPAALDLALCELWYAIAGALLHGAAMCTAESVPLEDFFRLVTRVYPESFREFAKGIETGDYEAGNATMITNAGAITHIVRASQDAGIDPSIAEALLYGMNRTIELGHGTDDLPSFYEAFNPLRSSGATSQLPD